MRHVAIFLTLMIGVVVHACAIDVVDFPVGDTQGEAGNGTGNGSGTAGGTAGGGGGPSEPGSIGAACEADTDCEEGLICVDEGYIPYGVANGMCTAECDATTLPCPGSAICNDGFCFEPCTYGDGDETKCHGRRDVACAALSESTTDGGCYPRCNHDDDCGERRCDPALGFCVTTPVIGPGHFGTGCGENDHGACRGICHNGRCHEFCTAGATNACQNAAGSAQCVGHLRTNGGVGDHAFCSPVCTCNAHCNPPLSLNTYRCNVTVGSATHCGISDLGSGTIPCDNG